MAQPLSKIPELMPNDIQERSFIVGRYYGMGYTLKQISERFKVSRNTISNYKCNDRTKDAFLAGYKRGQADIDNLNCEEILEGRKTLSEILEQYVPDVISFVQNAMNGNFEPTPTQKWACEKMWLAMIQLTPKETRSIIEANIREESIIELDFFGNIKK